MAGTVLAVGQQLYSSLCCLRANKLLALSSALELQAAVFLVLLNVGFDSATINAVSLSYCDKALCFLVFKYKAMCKLCGDLSHARHKQANL
jgi:hypothetical protein